MGRLKQRYEIAAQRLQALEKRIKTMHGRNLDDPDDSEMARESLIQRFEYTVDMFWKFIKLYLEEVQKVTLDIASPRGILRAAAESQIISQEELGKLLVAITDRNLTSHTYDADFAEEIVARIPAHYNTMNDLFKRFSIE